jgi:glycerol-3-phosphate dehydrogenase
MEEEQLLSVYDFFVGRTGRLYFEIATVRKYKEVVLQQCQTFLSLNDEQLAIERDRIDQALYAATHFD